MNDWISIALAVVSLIIMVLGFVYRKKLLKLQKYGYLGVFLVSTIGNIAIFSPAAVIVTGAAGIVYNVWIVGLFAALGAIAGQLITYHLASVGKTGEKKKDKDKDKDKDKKKKKTDWLDYIEKYMDKYGFLLLFLLAVLPNPMVDSAGVVAGRMTYPVGKFLLASYFGKTIKYAFFAFLGRKGHKMLRL